MLVLALECPRLHTMHGVGEQALTPTHDDEDLELQVWFLLVELAKVAPRPMLQHVRPHGDEQRAIHGVRAGSVLSMRAVSGVSLPPIARPKCRVRCGMALSCQVEGQTTVACC